MSRGPCRDGHADAKVSVHRLRFRGPRLLVEPPKAPSDKVTGRIKDKGTGHDKPNAQLVVLGLPGPGETAFFVLLWSAIRHAGHWLPTYAMFYKSRRATACCVADDHGTARASAGQGRVGEQGGCMGERTDGEFPHPMQDAREGPSAGVTAMRVCMRWSILGQSLSAGSV